MKAKVCELEAEVSELKAKFSEFDDFFKMQAEIMRRSKLTNN